MTPSSFLLLVLLLPEYITALETSNYMSVAYTDDQDSCITSCVRRETDRPICYLGWGRSNYKTCSLQPGSAKVKLPISFSKPCSSFCSQMGYTYNWCFTGYGGENDYCAPDPLPLGSLQQISRYLIGDLCNTNASPTAQGVPRNFGVNTAIFNMKRLLPERLILLDETYPLREYLTIIAPHINGMTDNVILPLMLRARIFKRHRSNVPDVVLGSSAARARMRNMNAKSSDSANRLLPTWLGGPTDTYTMVPMIARSANSKWRDAEIRQFLDSEKIRRVDWDLTVSYANVHQTRRPIGFGLWLRFYENHQLVRDFGEVFISNDHAQACL